MPTQQIEWADGSGDKIYITSPDFSGNQQIAVSSDPNTGAARSKVVTFSAGNVSKTLTVEQAAGQIQPVFYNRLIFDGIAYIDTDIVIPENGSFRAIFGNEQTKGTQRLFSADGIFDAYLNSNTNNTSRFFSACYGKTATVISGTQLPLSWSYSTYAFYLTPKRVGFGTNSKTFTKGNNSPIGGLVIGVNNTHTGIRYTGSMSTARIYGSDAQNITQDSDFNSYTPIYTLRPCTYNGEPGIWCVELNKFYGNSAGAGSLSVSN